VNAVGIAEHALDHAGPDSLALVTRERSLLLRFARSGPTQATAVDDLTVELAVLRSGHVGRAATNSIGDESLAACSGRAAAAADAAAAAAGRGSFPGFPAPVPPPAHHGYDQATARLDPEPGGAALTAVFERAAEAGVEAHGVWSTGEVEYAVATGDGAEGDRVTDAFMKVVCIAPSGRSGFASAAAVAAAGLDAHALTARAAGKAVAPEEPAELVPGDYPAVFAPQAVGTLLDMLGATAFNGLAHTEGRGALSDRLGQPVATPAVNLADSPRFAAGLPRPFDAEGTNKRPLPLIQDGVAHRVVHDIRSAALAGTESTGHALAPGGDPYGPHPTNLVLAGGGAADEEELCATIERGVYVTRLWYENVVRPKETLVTAVTRDGTFLIEDGRVSRPLRDLRLTESLLAIFSSVQALTSRQQLVSDGEFYGRRFAYGVVCPALRAGSARFTDAAG
jgi:predicted Zn-dependent protease